MQDTGKHGIAEQQNNRLYMYRVCPAHRSLKLHTFTELQAAGNKYITYLFAIEG